MRRNTPEQAAFEELRNAIYDLMKFEKEVHKKVEKIQKMLGSAAENIKPSSRKPRTSRSSLWYEEHKEYAKAKMREYYRKNKEKIRKQQKLYYVNNIEKIREYGRNYQRNLMVAASKKK